MKTTAKNKKTELVIAAVPYWDGDTMPVTMPSGEVKSYPIPPGMAGHDHIWLKTLKSGNVVGIKVRRVTYSSTWVRARRSQPFSEEDWHELSQWKPWTEIGLIHWYFNWTEIIH
jgi:hypothetical protein